MELYKGESKTARAEVKEHKYAQDEWRACLKGYNVYTKKWRIIQNKSFKSIDEANENARSFIREGLEHDALLEKYGKDPMQPI